MTKTPMFNRFRGIIRIWRTKYKVYSLISRRISTTSRTCTGRSTRLWAKGNKRSSTARSSHHRSSVHQLQIKLLKVRKLLGWCRLRSKTFKRSQRKHKSSMNSSSMPTWLHLFLVIPRRNQKTSKLMTTTCSSKTEPRVQRLGKVRMDPRKRRSQKAEKKSWKNFRREIRVSNKRDRSLSYNLSLFTTSNGIQIQVNEKKRSPKNWIRFQMVSDCSRFSLLW